MLLGGHALVPPSPHLHTPAAGGGSWWGRPCRGAAPRDPRGRADTAQGQGSEHRKGLAPCHPSSPLLLPWSDSASCFSTVPSPLCPGHPAWHERASAGHSAELKAAALQSWETLVLEVEVCSQWIYVFIYFFSLGDFFFHCFERGRGREKGRERGNHQQEREASVGWLPPVHAQTGARCLGQGLNLQPMYVPRLGIEPATFQLQANTLTNGAAPARAPCWS